MCARDPAPDQPAELPLRQRRDAHDRAGVHDGVPGGRPARAGPRARGRRLRVGRDEARFPRKALWEKPQGKNEPLRMEKHFRIVPRGIGLVIGCCTFPTWNGFPGFFADLATGNAVVVKPHPAAILPLALTVQDRARGAGRGGLRSRTSSRWSRTRPATTSRRSSRCGPRSGSSTSPAARRTATGWRRTRGRRRSTPRSPASTRSSSTRPTTSRASRATSRSRCRSTPGRCARRRRTSTCRKDGIDTADGPPDVRPGRRGHRRRRAEAARRPGARRRDPRRRGQRRRACSGWRRRARWATIVLDTQAIAHPLYPQATDPHAAHRQARRRRPRPATSPSGSARSRS